MGKHLGLCLEGVFVKDKRGVPFERVINLVDLVGLQIEEIAPNGSNSGDFAFGRSGKHSFDVVVRQLFRGADNGELPPNEIHAVERTKEL